MDTDNSESESTKKSTGESLEGVSNSENHEEEYGSTMEKTAENQSQGNTNKEKDTKSKGTLQDENENKVKKTNPEVSSRNSNDACISLPSTSKSKTESKKNCSDGQNPTQKRSKSREEDDINFWIADLNSSDEDSVKRQKLNQSEAAADTNAEICCSSDGDDSLNAGTSNSEANRTDDESMHPNHQDFETSPVNNMDLDDRSSSCNDSSLHDSSDSSDDMDTDNYSDRYNVEDNIESDGAISTSSSSSDEDMDQEDCNPAVLQKEAPKHTWCSVRELTNRQLGINQLMPTNFYGSLYAVENLGLLCQLYGHKGCVNTINFNNNGNLLASASDDLNVIIWDWAAKKKIQKIRSGHRSNVFQAKWLPLDDEKLMVTSARDGQVRLIYLETGLHRSIGAHSASCNKIATHKETPHVVLSAGEDSKVLSIDIREHKPNRLLKVRDGATKVHLYSIHSNPLRSNEFCVAGQMSSVFVYDRRQPTEPIQKMCPKHLLEKKYINITCAVYNHNGTEILASYNDEDIYLFDAVNPRPLGEYAHSYMGHRNSVTVKGVNFFGPKSEYIMSGSDCKNIFIWDKNTEAIVQWMEGDDEGTVNCLEPHPFIPVMATSGLDYDVKMWIPSFQNLFATSQKKDQNRESLERCVKGNLNKVRKARQEPEEGNIWSLLRDIHRHIRRQNGEHIGSVDDVDSDSNSSSSEYQGRLQCPPQ